MTQSTVLGPGDPGRQNPVSGAVGKLGRAGAACADADRKAPSAAAPSDTTGSAEAPLSPELAEVLPVMDDPTTAKLRGWAVARRRAELEVVLGLLEYVDSFVDSHSQRVTAQTEVLDARGSREAESVAKDAAITYAAQALGVSDYQTQKTYDDATLTREHLPTVWEHFTHLRVTQFAVSKIAQAARKLGSEPERLQKLDELVPDRAARMRPMELDAWLRRFTAVEDSEEHAAQAARNAQDRWVYIKPCEDIEGMSLLMAKLPTLVAETMGRRLSAVARSHIQKIPHNLVTAALEAEHRTAGGAATFKYTESGNVARDSPCPNAPGVARSAFGQIPAAPVSGDQFSRWRQATVAAPDERVLGESYDQGDTRTLAQREADLLCAWILNGTTPDRDTEVEARISLLVPIETLTDDADYPGTSRTGGDAIPASVVRYVARSPSIRRRWHTMYITDGSLPPDEAPGEYFYGPTGVEFNIAAHTYQGYQVPKLLREHIALRDGVCTAPGCTMPAERGDIDHRTPWPTGKTTAANLRALCRRHHNIKTAGFPLTTSEQTQHHLPKAVLWSTPQPACQEELQQAA
ncbi:HNH endonuclease signature motif containing protein [Nesterenkonia ebinurensis]|uniref:HNH endonuclease signature motif containing protein n=1 Tax=Nesterenkonia ebinurensis TaxID=2608252 RepID=UPI00123D2B83|nr:HNH endonuclease signature motif containing protein [Nesterenkonia ebinurensis]